MQKNVLSPFFRNKLNANFKVKPRSSILRSFRYIASTPAITQCIAVS